MNFGESLPFLASLLALLLGGGVVYMALGDLKEAIILLIFATLSVVMPGLSIDIAPSIHCRARL